MDSKLLEKVNLDNPDVILLLNTIKTIVLKMEGIEDCIGQYKSKIDVLNSHLIIEKNKLTDSKALNAQQEAEIAKLKAEIAKLKAENTN
jgi:hypothetical protein